jgi:hypothetical protein
VIIGAICYQIATKNMASGFGAESWGSAPSLSHLFAVVRERYRDVTPIVNLTAQIATATVLLESAPGSVHS